MYLYAQVILCILIHNMNSKHSVKSITNCAITLRVFIAPLQLQIAEALLQNPFNSLGPKFISLGHFQSIEHLNIP